MKQPFIIWAALVIYTFFSLLFWYHYALTNNLIWIFLASYPTIGVVVFTTNIIKDAKVSIRKIGKTGENIKNW
jgi:hypothetical protein